MVPVRNYNQNWLPNAFNDFFDNDWMVKANATAPSINVSEEDKKGKKYLRREFSYTKFQQTLALPDNVVRDQISANVKDGILNVELPKQLEEPKPQHRAIEVK